MGVQLQTSRLARMNPPPPKLPSATLEVHAAARTTVVRHFPPFSFVYLLVLVAVVHIRADSGALLEPHCYELYMPRIYGP